MYVQGGIQETHCLEILTLEVQRCWETKTYSLPLIFL